MWMIRQPGAQAGGDLGRLVGVSMAAERLGGERGEDRGLPASRLRRRPLISGRVSHGLPGAGW
jgi:hypothetical protein